MKKYLWLLVGAAFAAVLWGCSGKSSTDDPGPKGPPPPTVEPTPGMKAPEDRPGMKKDGGGAGAG